MDIEVSSLDHAVHSGLWGGPIPDAGLALSKILASLVDDEGVINLPEILEMVRPTTDAQRAQAERLPSDAKDFRDQVGMLEGLERLNKDINPFAANWWRPTLNVNAMQADSKKTARSILVPRAWARIGVRTVPNMKASRVAEVLEKALHDRAPWGVKVKTDLIATGDWWETDTDHEAFAAAARALEKGYDNPTVLMGCGGSIPFVEPFARELGGVPALLIGVEDPYTNAHGENESLDLGDFHKATRSAIYLYEELAKVLG
jgi:acetylornithine deacetylase/succinyl-diaminopimelate desuccinylase-like protein